MASVEGREEALFLGRGMLCKDFNAVPSLELTNETRVPVGQLVEDRSSIMMSTHQSSLATPKSLQHLIRALLLHASVAVGMP